MSSYKYCLTDSIPESVIRHSSALNRSFNSSPMDIPITSSSHSNSSSSEENDKSGKPSPPAYRSALHSVRKFPGNKNVIMKKPIAPMPPTPPKIYKVNPVDFRDVVQRLTGALEFQHTRLQEVAPPPLTLSPPPQEEITQEKPAFDGGNCGGMSPLGFSLSPSSMAWCSSILMSPRTLSS